MTNTAPHLPQAFEKLTAGDVAGAVEAVLTVTDASVALDGLGQLCKQAYGDLKSISAMNAIAWEAIKFGLICAESSNDPESARRYKTRVRTIAYNAGSNCWPGWGDPIKIEAIDIAEGLRLAERNHELVRELGLGAKEMGGSFWLRGALLLANGQVPAAITQFVAAQEAFHDAGLSAYEFMARGYAALARKALPLPHSIGSQSLADILESLRAMQSKEALFFAEQLVTADRIFSSR